MPDNTNIGGTMQNNNTNSNIELKPDKLMSIIYERKNELEKACSLLKSEIEKSPKGCLRISASRGSTQYYHKTTSKNPVVKYIPKSDINLVYLLAQKNYDQKLMKELNKELNTKTTLLNKLHSVGLNSSKSSSASTACRIFTYSKTSCSSTFPSYSVTAIL